MSEVFNPGTGGNTVLAGDSAGDYDELDYSQMGVRPRGGRLGGHHRRQGIHHGRELEAVRAGGPKPQRPELRGLTAQYATLAALVVALEQQVEAAAAAT